MQSNRREERKEFTSFALNFAHPAFKSLLTEPSGESSGYAFVQKPCFCPDAPVLSRLRGESAVPFCDRLCHSQRASQRRSAAQHISKRTAIGWRVIRHHAQPGRAHDSRLHRNSRPSCQANSHPCAASIQRRLRAFSFNKTRRSDTNSSRRDTCDGGETD